MNSLQDFLSHLSGFGFIVKDYKEGVFNRCSTTTSKNNKKPAYFIYNISGENTYGMYSDFREGINYYWPSEIQIEHKRELVKKMKQDVDVDLVSLAFTGEYNLCNEVQEHEYLKNKHINVNNLKGLVKSKNDFFVIPVYNLDRQIVGVQTIKEDGAKKFAHDSVCKGSFFEFPNENKNKIVICEGFATGYSLWISLNCTVIIAFSCGNIKPVAIGVQSKYPESKIIIAADNDKPDKQGKKAGIEHALKVKEFVKCEIKLPEIEGEDFNDIYRRDGKKGIEKYFYELTSLFEIGLSFTKQNWMIKNYIQADCNFCIFGQPGSGKSFVALYLLMCVSNGATFFGEEPDKEEGYVIYVCGEDFNYSKARAKALANKYGFRYDNFIITTNPVHFLNKEQVEEVINNIETLKLRGIKIKMIIIDTLNANFGDGDENKTEDMTKLLNSLQDIRKASTNVCIGVVHHSSKANDSLARGSGALYGNVAAAWKVHMDKETAEISITSIKQKNAPDFQPLIGKLVPMILNEKDANTGESIQIDTAYFEEVSNYNPSTNVINSINELTKAVQIDLKKYESICFALKAEANKNLTERMRKSRIEEIFAMWSIEDMEPYLNKLKEDNKISKTDQEDIFLLNIKEIS